MWFFRRKSKASDAEAERIVKDIHVDTIKRLQKAGEKIDKDTKPTQKLIDLIDEKNLGTTEFIFYATGGDKRK